MVDHQLSCIDGEMRDTILDALGFRRGELEDQMENLRSQIKFNEANWKSTMKRQGILIPEGYGRENHIAEMEDELMKVKEAQRFMERASRCEEDPDITRARGQGAKHLF